MAHKMEIEKMVEILEKLEFIMGVEGCSLSGIIAEECAREIYNHLGMDIDDRFTVTMVGTC